MKKHQQSGRSVTEMGYYSISNTDLSDYASVDNIAAIFIGALVVLIRTNNDTRETLTIWRKNSSGLPIKGNIDFALDLIEPILLGDYGNVLKVLYTYNEKVEKLLAASLRVMHNAEASIEDLLFAQSYVASSFINSPWEELVIDDLVILISSTWLEKVKFRAKLNTPNLTVPQIKEACQSSETGKNKIGKILIAVHKAVSVKVPLSEKFFQMFEAWTEAEHQQESTIGKNTNAQRLIKTMEKPPHLTDEDIEALNQSIREGEIPIKFNSPFESDEPDSNE